MGITINEKNVNLKKHDYSKRIDAAIERKTILNKVGNPNEHP